MHVDIIPNRNSNPAVLLREGRREGKRIVKKTLANLSHLPMEQVVALREVLAGNLQCVSKLAIERSLPHGHVHMVLGMMRKLGIDSLLGSRRCRERDLVMAMIVQQVLDPCSKLATTRQWGSSTLSQTLSVEDADVNELYGALDWLEARQKRIENKLAKRRLSEGATVLYDVSSSSYHGHSCSLAQWGYNRDGEKLRSIVYGLMTDAEGCPIAIDVYAGNTADPKTVPDQVDKLCQRFGLERAVLVGDRGMLTQPQVEHLKNFPNLGWISALRYTSIRDLAESGQLQMSLFDTQNLAEITSPEYPGERLIACFNPFLAEERKQTRDALLERSEKKLRKIAAEAARRTQTPMAPEQIAEKIGRALAKDKMAKHFQWEILNHQLIFQRDETAIAREASLDGIYIIRTSESRERLSAEQTVRNYKRLAEVEAAFRSLKSIDLQIRPIRHYQESRVRAHIFLSMLSYYVMWHIKKALGSILFNDETLDESRNERDPVLKAKPTEHAKTKKRRKTTAEGWPLHSFHSLLCEMATHCKNTCRIGEGKATAHITLYSEPTPLQQHVYQLLDIKP